MMLSLTSIFTFILYFSNSSLDSLLFFNIFLSVCDYPLTEILGYLTRQEVLEIIIINSHGLIFFFVIGYIYCILIANMFNYSFVNYFLMCLFDFQRVSGIFAYEVTWFRDFIVSDFLNKSKYLDKKILVYEFADNLAISLLLLGVLISYNWNLHENDWFLTTDTSVDYESTTLVLFWWVSFFYGSINVGLSLDHLSIMMLVVVLFISTLVHYYSIDYMANDPRLLTFLKYLSGFTLAMVVLVTADNFALLFLGWEGVGIFSYLLIGFWYTRTLALKASLKAVIVNWIGDIALIIAAALTLHYFGTLDFKWLHNLIPFLFSEKIDVLLIDFFFFDVSIVSLISFFLLIAAIGKSAQFGLHTWLPDAMEGPTPVSALIHAATMVTAGVYLIVWTSFFFEFSESIKNLTLLVGAFTALFGSITACYQHDIKWIIAFSTCSQLGYMFLACGLSAYNVAMFHLFIHAFFKALLFLCAGSVIHAINDEQDIRKMGGLLNILPITYTGLCIGFLSLTGIPFTSGFFSKDTIIELALTNWTEPALYGYICGSMGAFFTAFYSSWFFYYVIFGTTKLSRAVLSSIKEHGNNMLGVLIILSSITIFIGGLTKNPLTSPFSFIFFDDSIFVINKNFYFNLYENFLEFYIRVHDYVFNYLKLILFIIPFVAMYFSSLNFWLIDLKHGYNILYMVLRYRFEALSDLHFYSRYVHTIESSYYTQVNFWKFFETKSGADEFYNKFFVKPLIYFSYYICYKELDWGWLEYLLVKVPTFTCFAIAKVLNQTFGSLKLNFLPGMLYLVLTLLFLIMASLVN